MEDSYSQLPNKLVSASDGINYAYRDTGGHDGAVPLVLLQHFRGNLDNWDPPLVDALASGRRVITFDYAGVGASSGAPAGTAGRMASETIAFITALELAQVDLLGFSAALLLPARRADPPGQAEDLPRRGARVPVPASQRVRGRRDPVPGLRGIDDQVINGRGDISTPGSLPRRPALPVEQHHSHERQP
jgi:hypothetical protein